MRICKRTLTGTIVTVLVAACAPTPPSPTPTSPAPAPSAPSPTAENGFWVLPASFAGYATTTGEQAQPTTAPDGSIRVHAVYGYQDVDTLFHSFTVFANSLTSAHELLLSSEPEGTPQAEGEAECVSRTTPSVTCAITYRQGAVLMQVGVADDKVPDVAALVTQMRDELPG